MEAAFAWQAGSTKSGQGYWVRLMSAIRLRRHCGVGAGVALGGNGRCSGLRSGAHLRAASVPCLWRRLCFGGSDWAGCSSERRKRTVEFLIATEGEMKQGQLVESSGDRVASTRAVIAMTIMTAVYCCVVLTSSSHRSSVG